MIGNDDGVGAGRGSLGQSEDGDVECLPGPVDQMALGQDRSRPGVFGHEAKAFAWEIGIERYERGPSLEYGEDGHHRLDGAIGHDPNALVGPVDQRLEPPGHVRGQTVELLVGP